MTWSYFIIFAIISVICWTVGAVASWKGKKTMAYALIGIGLAVFFTYILYMWINLERPPLRTMERHGCGIAFSCHWQASSSTVAGIINGYSHSVACWLQCL